MRLIGKPDPGSCTHEPDQGDGHCAHCGWVFVESYVHHRCPGCLQELCLVCAIYQPWKQRKAEAEARSIIMEEV